MSGCNVYNNVANDHGGGIDNYYSTATVKSSNVYNNVAKRSGGGIYNYRGTVKVTSSKIIRGSAKQGADVYSYGKFTAKSSKITHKKIIKK